MRIGKCRGTNLLVFASKNMDGWWCLKRDDASYFGIYCGIGYWSKDFYARKITRTKNEILELASPFVYTVIETSWLKEGF